MQNQSENPPTHPPVGGQPIQVKASDEVLKGIYANQVLVGHTGEEFILDFITQFPPNAVLGGRVIMSPSHAKRFMTALENNIQQYEKNFGTISLAIVPDNKIKFN